MIEKLNLSKDSKVLVLGAHKGGDAVRIHKRYGCTVYAVEPSNSAFPRLIKVSQGRDIVPLKLAVGEKNGTVVFYEFGNLFPDGKGNSLFQRHKDPDRWRRLKNPCSNPPLWLRKAYKVLCLDVKTLLEHLGLDYVDVLVCDVEGAERYIVDQIIKLADHFGQIDMEFHPQIYGKLLNYDLIDKMARLFNFVTNKTNHILFER